jgi:hypothetical protein
MRTIIDSFMRDNTLKAIRIAMNIEQIGSAIIQPKRCIRTADMITPTEPKVSARIWRKTPLMICEFPMSNVWE